jgi:hypothetical protein
MATCTIFKNFTIPVENKSLLLIANDIASIKYKEAIEEIRTLLEQGKLEEATDKKKQLLAFTPSGIFNETRKIDYLEMYSGFVHLDFDKLTPIQLNEASKIISEIPYTFLCFISPSGNGLKVFIEVDTEVEYHTIAYLQVLNHYENATSLKADQSCKDIPRLCFMSYDPGLYKNIKNEKFKVQIPENIQQNKIQVDVKKEIPSQNVEFDTELDIIFVFEQQIKFTNQKSEYIQGNRSNYIYQLASNCNRAGLPQLDTETLCIQQFDLPESEIKETVKSAYFHHKSEFAKFANAAKLQTAKELQIPDEEPLEDYLKNTPTIPDEVFETLPFLLKEGTKVFTDKRKRDVFFTSAIAILSGCLPNVTGIYFQERVYPHLYTFIIAPAASGKGVLKNAKRLAQKYHQKVLTQSKEKKLKYEADLADYKRLEYQGKGDETSPEKPQLPAFKIIFIPADCSKARMIEHLKANDGNGIICESEADTMSGAKKQDWGDYSTILRAAFHHETVSSTRKTDNQYDEITEPRLAVALSGTPAQAPALLSSSENGLFSRFIYYAYKNNIKWQDPSPNSNGFIYNDHFDKLSEKVLELVNYLENSPTTIELTDSQWSRLNTDFSSMLKEVVIFTSEEASGVVFRLGLIFFRMCMLFSSLRKFENGELSSTIICTDLDFYNVMEIVKTYLSHSILMFNNLPNQNETMQFHSGDGKKRFFESLPQEFTRKEAIEIGKKFKLSDRTVDGLLKSCIGVLLTKIKAGHYQRV